MSDRETLLRAIIAAPDEDTPRLAYADLLDEIGGELNTARARFIRVQIDLARNPGRSWFANSDRLCEVSRLAGLFADVWLNELPKWAADEARKQRLRADDFPRGFLSAFHIKSATFALKGDELLAAAPVTRIVVPGARTRADLAALLVSPFLLRVRELTLSPTNGDLAAALVKASRALHAVEELDLSRSALTDAGATALTQSLALSKLRVLVVRENPLTESGVVNLLLAPKLPNLRTLDIRGVPDVYRWRFQLRGRFPQKTVLV